jgi:hypothetical protein
MLQTILDILITLFFAYCIIQAILFFVSLILGNDTRKQSK